MRKWSFREVYLPAILFSCPVVSNSLWLLGLQHVRPPCPSPTPRVYSNSCPLSQWCHTGISFSDSLSSFCPQSSPAFRDFSTESSVCIRWPKYCSFSFSPSSEYSGLMSLKIDWFDLLAAQGTLKSLFQHHISKASILQNSAFFMVQLKSVPDDWKTIASIIWSLVSKMISLLSSMLFRFAIAFLLRSKPLLISWLQ